MKPRRIESIWKFLTTDFTNTYSVEPHPVRAENPRGETADPPGRCEEQGYLFLIPRRFYLSDEGSPQFNVGRISFVAHQELLLHSTWLLRMTLGT
jgi:hypothetical protein